MDEKPKRASNSLRNVARILLDCGAVVDEDVMEGAREVGDEEIRHVF